MKKIYVTPTRQVSIICDECGGTYTNKVPTHICGNVLVKARCRCGHDTDLIFEFRQAYRKSTSLRGRLQKHATGTKGQAVQVQNLSRDGIKFATSEWHNIHQADLYTLTFTLDNNQRSTIDKKIQIKYIDGKMIGAQFCPEDQLTYQKEIGFYLMG
jgi:hypothetical protein